MKVGFDVSQVVFGSGVSDYTQNIVDELPKKIITSVGFSLNQTSLLKKNIPGVKSYRIPLSIIEQLWNKLHIIKFEKFSGNIDIYHASDWTQAPSDAKKITTIHDLSPFLYPQEVHKDIVEVHKRKMYWAEKECEAFICVSQNTARDLKRVFSISASKIFVVPEALPKRFMLSPKKSKYSEYIVTIGSRQPRKNIQKLIQAYEKNNIAKKLGLKLVVIGENGLTTKNDNIIFTGYVSEQELVDIVAGAEVCVYPSLYEGFGLPALVSFYHQTPFVCSNNSSLPEVVSDAGVLVDTNSESEIIDGIYQAIKNRTKLIKAGTQRQKQFSWRSAAEKTYEIYSSLIK